MDPVSIWQIRAQERLLIYDCAEHTEHTTRVACVSVSAVNRSLYAVKFIKNVLAKSQPTLLVHAAAQYGCIAIILDPDLGPLISFIFV